MAVFSLGIGSNADAKSKFVCGSKEITGELESPPGFCKWVVTRETLNLKMRFELDFEFEKKGFGYRSVVSQRFRNREPGYEKDRFLFGTLLAQCKNQSLLNAYGILEIFIFLTFKRITCTV